MKSLFLAALAGAAVLAFTANAQAHVLDELKKATNPGVEAARSSGEKFAANLDKSYHPDGDKGGGGVVYAGYLVDQLSPKKDKTGKIVAETAEDAMIRVAKFALHRDYPITGDDSGYDLTAIKSAKEVESQFAESFTMDEQSSPTKSFRTALATAIKAGGLVYFAVGSGNNTASDIVLVIDVKNKEFFYVMDSNFGSDD